MDEIKLYDNPLSASEIRELAGRPVAEWTFDDPGDLGNDTGIGYVGAGAFDLSAASGFTAPDYDAAGKVGGAAFFTNDTAFATPADVYPNGSFTFTGWFKPSDASISAAITPFSRRGGFELFANSGDWRARVWKQDNTFVYKVGTAIVADEWIHIALSFSTTNAPDASGNYTGSFIVWVNGENLGGITNAEYCANDTYTLNVGAAGGYDYRGLMDEVRIYDYDLSETEIRALAFWAPEIGDISIIMDGSDAIISWFGTNGVSYALQTKGNLVLDPSWSNEVPGIIGVLGSMSATSTVTAVQSFYRVVIEE